MESEHKLDTFRREIGDLLKMENGMHVPVGLELACVALFKNGLSAETIKERHLKFLVKIQDLTEGTNSIVTALIARIKNKMGKEAALDVELSKELSNIETNMLKKKSTEERAILLLLAAHLTGYEDVYKEIADIANTEEKKDLLSLVLSDLTTSNILQQISSEDYKQTIIMSLAHSSRPDWILADLKRIIRAYSPVTDNDIISLLPYITAPGFGIAELIVDLSCPEYSLDKIIAHIHAVKNINDSSRIRDVIKLLCETIPGSKSHIIDNLELFNTDHELSTKDVDQFFDRLCNASQNPDIRLVKFYLDDINLKLANGEKPANTHEARFIMVKNMIGLSNILREKEYLDEEILHVLHFVITHEKSGNKFSDFLNIHRATNLEHLSDIDKKDYQIKTKILNKIHKEQENKVDALKTFYLACYSNKLYGQALTSALVKIDEIYPTVVPSFNQAMLGLMKRNQNENSLGMFAEINDLAVFCSELNEIEKKNESVLENVDEEKRGMYVLQSFLGDEPLLNLLKEEKLKDSESERDSLERAQGVNNN